MSEDPFLIDGHKIHYHPTRLAQWNEARTIEEKLAVYPVYVEISPVGNCNHRCTFCAVDYIGYKMRRIETRILDQALLSMALHGVKSVMFAGEGEPMLHPDIDYLTQSAHAYGLDVAFTTNGTALTKKFVDSSLKSTKWIKVSMNGGPSSYATIHRTKEADYEKVWGNIQYAIAARNQGLSSCTIGIQCVVLPENQHDLESIIRRASITGCDYVVLKPYSQHKSSPSKTYEKISYQEQVQTLQKLRLEFSNATFKVIVRTQAMEEWDKGAHSYDKCHATPFFWAYIMATGDVYGCSAYLLDDKFRYGNINSESFKEIWTGIRRAASIEYVEKSLDISQCRVNCRMNQVNKYLFDVANPSNHKNFI